MTFNVGDILTVRGDGDAEVTSTTGQRVHYRYLDGSGEGDVLIAAMAREGIAKKDSGMSSQDYAHSVDTSVLAPFGRMARQSWFPWAALLVVLSGWAVERFQG